MASGQSLAALVVCLLAAPAPAQKSDAELLNKLQHPVSNVLMPRVRLILTLHDKVRIYHVGGLVNCTKSTLKISTLPSQREWIRRTLKALDLQLEMDVPEVKALDYGQFHPHLALKELARAVKRIPPSELQSALARHFGWISDPRGIYILANPSTDQAKATIGPKGKKQHVLGAELAGLSPDKASEISFNGVDELVAKLQSRSPPDHAKPLSQTRMSQIYQQSLQQLGAAILRQYVADGAPFGTDPLGRR